MVIGARVARLHSVEEVALPYREQRLTRSLGRLDVYEHPVDVALLVDGDGLLMAAYGDPTHADELGALAVHPSGLGERFASLLGDVRALSFTLADGRVLAVRGIGYGDCRLVTVSRGAVESARGERVARELRLLLD